VQGSVLVVCGETGSEGMWLYILSFLECKEVQGRSKEGGRVQGSVVKFRLL